MMTKSKVESKYGDKIVFWLNDRCQFAIKILRSANFQFNWQFSVFFMIEMSNFGQFHPKISKIGPFFIENKQNGSKID